MIDSHPYFQTEWAASDLRRAALRGGTVTLVGQACRLFVMIGTTMVLARLLTPADFGLVAMVAAIMSFAGTLKDMGLSMATVQRAEIGHGQVSTLFWLNTTLGFALTLVMLAAAPLVAWIYDEPRLVGITIVLATAFLGGGLTVQHQALLRRRMQFGRLVATDLGSMVFGAVLAIVMALLGAGYWALVLRPVAVAAATAGAVWMLCSWRPGRPVRRAGVRSLLAFGGHLTGFNVLNALTRNLDKALVGWRWGAQPLGFYTKAYQLLLLPIHQVNAPLTSVAIPTLSRLQSDPLRYRSYYRRGLLLVVSIGMPVVVLLCAEAERAVLLLLGSQWSATVPLFRALAPAAFVGTFNVATGWVYVSTGRTDRQWRWSILATAITLAAIIFGLRWGAIGVATAFSLSTVGLLYPAIVYCFRTAPVGFRDLIAALWRPAAAAVAAGLLMYAARSRGEFLPAGILLGLLVSGAVYLLLYAILWLALPGGRRQLADMMRILGELRPRRRGGD